MKGNASASPITQLRHSGEPKVMVPRQICETLSPVVPRLTYFMLIPRCARATLTRLMQLFDVHAHLTHPQLLENIEAVVARAKAAGLTSIVSNGLNPADNA